VEEIKKEIPLRLKEAGLQVIDLLQGEKEIFLKVALALRSNLNNRLSVFKK
jgi:hypothetical protein